MGRKALGDHTMTSAERKRKSRLKQIEKVNSVEFKAKEAQRKKLKLVELKSNKQAYDQFLENDRNRKRDQYQKKPTTIKMGFTSKSSFSRSMKKIESNLPKSPSKRNQIVKALVRKSDIKLVDFQSTSGRKKALSPENEEELYSFLCQGFP